MSSQPAPVTFEHLTGGLGIGVPEPRLSWTLPSGAGHQTGYEIEIRRDGVTERTGRIAGSRQILVPWPSRPLASRERVTVRVRVWTTGCEPSAWSAPSTVEGGLLRPSDWSARPVGAAWPA